MEKTVKVGRTIKGKKVRNNVHIHDDLAFSILSKLPLKSCKRFRCVRKSWSLLFKNPNFMNMFRHHFLSNNRSEYGDTLLLISEAELPLTNERKYHNALYLLPNEMFDQDRIKLDLPPPFEEHDTNIHILASASINGILCLMQDWKSGSVNFFRIVLWNPGTREFMVIPPGPDESVPPYHRRDSQFIGFGYDRVQDDYKVIRSVDFIFEFDPNEHVPKEDTWHDPMLEIYSLRSNSWRIIHANLHDCYFAIPNGVYLNGMCHWWAEIGPVEVREGFLVSFDFTDEVFLETPMMVDLGDRVTLVPMVLNKSVALISYCYDTHVSHIFILGDLGEEKSWFKLCIIRLIPPIVKPYGVWKNGNFYFRKKNYEPIRINLSTRLIYEFGITRENYGCLIGIYKENLLSRIGGTHY